MHKHSKPFDLEHAKAGAPVSLEDGHEVRILCFDRKNASGFPIVALVTTFDKTEIVYCFKNDGVMSRNRLVMLPLGYIDDKPVFVDDVFINPNGYKCKASVGDKVRSFVCCSWPTKVRKEVWQARFKGEQGGEYIHWGAFSSKEECEKAWKSATAFIRAERINTYEITE